MQMGEDGPARPVFVIVLPEILVAQDLEIMIRDILPDAAVVVARTLDETAAILPPGRIVAAVVQQAPARAAATDMGERLRADGGRFVMLDPDPSDQLPQGWASMPLPFVEEDVAALIKDCVPRSAG